MEELFNECDGQMTKFFSAIEAKLSVLYNQLSINTLELMNEDKLSHTEGKLLIAE